MCNWLTEYLPTQKKTKSFTSSKYKHKIGEVSCAVDESIMQTEVTQPSNIFKKNLIYWPDVFVLLLLQSSVSFDSYDCHYN